MSKYRIVKTEAGNYRVQERKGHSDALPPHGDRVHVECWDFISDSYDTLFAAEVLFHSLVNRDKNNIVARIIKEE